MTKKSRESEGRNVQEAPYLCKMLGWYLCSVAFSEIICKCNFSECNNFLLFLDRNIYGSVVQSHTSAVWQSYQIWSYSLNSTGGILLNQELFLTTFIFLLYSIYTYMHIFLQLYFCLWQQTCNVLCKGTCLVTAYHVLYISNICTDLCWRNDVEIQDFPDASQELRMRSTSDQLLIVFLFQ